MTRLPLSHTRAPPSADTCSVTSPPRAGSSSEPSQAADQCSDGAAWPRRSVWAGDSGGSSPHANESGPSTLVPSQAAGKAPTGEGQKGTSPAMGSVRSSFA